MDYSQDIWNAYGLQPPSGPPQAPPPVDASLPGSTPNFDLPPAVAQAYGLAPPPPPANPAPAIVPPQPLPPPGPAPDIAPPPLPPPPPTQLPSEAENRSAPPGPPSPGNADFHVTPEQAGLPPEPQKPQPAPKPLTPEQMAQQAQSKQDAADQASANAIRGQADVTRAEAAQEVQAFDAHATAARQIQAQRDALTADIAKTHAEKQQYVDDTLKAVDNYKIDQSKYWNDIGMEGHVGWYIAMAMSEVGRALQRKDGPNPVLQMLQDRAHQAVLQQVDERDQLKEKNARAEHSLDKFDAFSRDRQAQIDLLDARNDKMLAQQLQMAAVKSKDPQAIATAQAGVAQLMQSSAEKATRAADAAAQHDIAKKQLGVAMAAHAETRRHNMVEEGWQQKKFEEEQQLKAAALLAKQQGKLTDDESKRAIFAPGPDGTMQPLRKKDGEIVMAGSPDLAQKQRDMVAAATSYNRLVGQMVRGIQDHGGESTWIKGAEWQKMMSDLQSATAELHDAYGITSFREPTVQFFEKMATSGVDPTSFVRDASGALQNSNKNLQAKVNEKLGAVGYDGPPIKWTDTATPPAPTNTPEDRLDQLVASKRGDDPGAVYQPETGTYAPKVTGMYTVDPDAPPTTPPPTARDKQVAAEYPKMGAGQRAALETFALWASSPDPTMRDRGVQHLADAVKNANETDVKAYAQQLLTNLGGAGIPEPTEAITGGSGQGYSSTGGSSTAPPPAMNTTEFLRNITTGAPGRAAMPMR